MTLVRYPLTDAQQQYAALDAYTGVWIAACVQALHAPAEDTASWLAAQAAALAKWRVLRREQAGSRQKERKKEARAGSRVLRRGSP